MEEDEVREYLPTIAIEMKELIEGGKFRPNVLDLASDIYTAEFANKVAKLPLFEISRQPTEVPTSLLQMAASEEVILRQSFGDKVVSADMARQAFRKAIVEQSKPFFTLDILVDKLFIAMGKNPSDVWEMERDELYERIRKEAEAGHLRVRHPENLLVESFENWADPSRALLVTSLADANEWLSIQGVPYRLSSQTGSTNEAYLIDKPLAADNINEELPTNLNKKNEFKVMVHAGTHGNWEAVYKQSEWEDIFQQVAHLIDGRPDETFNPLIVKEDGIWSSGWGMEAIDWHPYSELDKPITHSPRHHPYLPFPFSARDLAAFMLDGLGYFVRSKFGEWADGPIEDVLAEMPKNASTAKHAVKCAFDAYRDAIKEVGELDPTYVQLERDCNDARATANETARALLGDARMNESPEYQQAKMAHQKAKLEAEEAEAVWRKKMVQYLLNPGCNKSAVTANVTTGQATQVEQPATGTGKVWTEQRKAEARAYRIQHGLTKTAEYYKVSVTTISKHIPAGKVKPKKVTPFSGLGSK
jgi:hypothetical protein